MVHFRRSSILTVHMKVWNANTIDRFSSQYSTLKFHDWFMYRRWQFVCFFCLYEKGDNWVTVGLTPSRLSPCRSAAHMTVWPCIFMTYWTFQWSRPQKWCVHTIHRHTHGSCRCGSELNSVKYGGWRIQCRLVSNFDEPNFVNGIRNGALCMVSSLIR